MDFHSGAWKTLGGSFMLVPHDDWANPQNGFKLGNSSTPQFPVD